MDDDAGRAAKARAGVGEGAVCAAKARAIVNVRGVGKGAGRAAKARAVSPLTVPVLQLFQFFSFQFVNCFNLWGSGVARRRKDDTLIREAFHIFSF